MATHNCFSDKPQWVQEISSSTVDLSDTASLYCKATASPPANYRWMKNGEFFYSSGNVTITKEDQGSRLEITDVTTGDDGMYQCMAENEHGYLFSSAKLTVQREYHEKWKSCFFISFYVNRAGDLKLKNTPV